MPPANVANPAAPCVVIKLTIFFSFKRCAFFNIEAEESQRERAKSPIGNGTLHCPIT